MSQLNLPLPERSYDIFIEKGLLSESPLVVEQCSGEKVLILTNKTLGPIFLDKLENNLIDKDIYQFIIEDGEIHKNLSNFRDIIDFLIENQFRRNDTLIALGGGVVGDLGGFVASSFQRGMRFIQAPTSLLAQVDSSVGGKTAVNHPLGKNMIGAFYQPNAVFIDLNTLDSLPDREFISGIAEIVKYALLGDKRIESLLFSEFERILERDKKILSELIYYSCAAKAKVVSDDEKEQGSRALLNLGHTFAHAIEKVTHYREYLHGEAVSIGIMMAINLSLAKKMISNDFADRYRNLLSLLGLPIKTNQSLSLEELVNAMKIDKKNINKSFRLVLPLEDHCIIIEENDASLIMQSIEKQLA